MPSKSKRRATRQAQLSGRRRRREGRPRGEAAAQSNVQEVRRQVRPEPVAATVSAPETPSTVQSQEATAAVATRSRRRSSRARAPMEPLQMYPYLGSELRRIGALTGLMAVALGVLTFVLG